MAEQPAAPEPDVPMPVLVRFVRQLSHDLRNHLNAAELQSAFIGEIAEDAEVKEEVKRLRGLFNEMSSALQKLSGSFQDLKLSPLPYKAEDFLHDLRRKIEAEYGEAGGSLEWEIAVAPGATLQVDPQQLQQAFMELFDNAFRHNRAAEPIAVRAQTSRDQLEFELREPKREFAAETASWGRVPLRHLKHGHYGLGLYRARRIIERHGAQFEAQFDRAHSCLVTQVRLPLASESAE